MSEPAHRIKKTPFLGFGSPPPKILDPPLLSSVMVTTSIWFIVFQGTFLMTFPNADQNKL